MHSEIVPDRPEQQQVPVVGLEIIDFQFVFIAGRPRLVREIDRPCLWGGDTKGWSTSAMRIVSGGIFIVWTLFMERSIRGTR